MSDLQTEIAILGGGSAGYAAARSAAASGLKTTVIDGSRTLGGLCILRGCMPSKALIESANRFLTLRRAAEFGLRAREIEVQAIEVQRRKQKLIAEFAEYRQAQLAGGNFDLVRGTAAFLDPHTIDITLLENGSRIRLHAGAVIVATGSRISNPDLPGLAEAGFWTSDAALDSDRIPDSVVILGGGAIALEMAHLLEGLGAATTVVQRSPRVLKELDPDVTAVLEDAMRRRGITLFTDTALREVTVAGDLKTVHFRLGGGQDRSVSGREILVALGRTPATEGLRLGDAGVQTDGFRIVTDEHQATSSPNIFAAGDVCSPHEVVHIAIQQGEVAAANAAAHLGKGVAGARRAMDYRLKLIGIFTEPEVAAVGLTEAEAAATGIRVRVAAYPFNDHGKSLVMGETEGFVKLIADVNSGEIVGAAAIGPEAVELIHEIVVAMHFRATPAQLASIPHYHPTLSEIWTYPAEELAEQI